jgi:hypothetical protein
VAVPDYTGLFRFVYDWQTFIAGMGAIYGGWLAYRAGIRQATATREAARDQIAALEQQNADLKLADQRKLARERLAVAGLLYTSLGVVVGQIEYARSRFSGPADALLDEQTANSVRHEVEKPGFAYLWQRLGVFEGAIVAGFLSLEIAVDRMRAETGPVPFGPLKDRLDNLSKLAQSLRSLAPSDVASTGPWRPISESGKAEKREREVVEHRQARA